MNNVVDNDLSILNGLTEIDEKLATYKNIISFQKEEICKTESLISEFQNHLLKQNEALNKYIEEEKELIEQRDNIVNYNTNLNEYSNIPKNSRNQRKRKRNDIIKIDEFKGPCRGYKAIMETISKSDRPIMTFEDQTQIPNALKFIEERRKMVLIYVQGSVNNENETITKESPELAVQYFFKDILGHELTTDTYVHIGLSKEVQIIYTRDERYGNELVKPKYSYFITRDDTIDTSFGFQVKGKAFIALDIINNMQIEHSSPLMPVIEMYDFTPSEEVKYQKSSFLRRQMTPEEIRKKIIFMDIEWATNADLQVIPICLAALNYFGVPLFDSKICPRKYVSNYRQSKHGLLEIDLICQEDSFDAISRFKTLLRNKIVVGYDIHMKLMALQIDLNTLGGIRDISTSTALQKVMFIKTGGKKCSWRLTEIIHTLKICDQQLKLHTALGDSKVIRKVYLKLEADWEDTPQNIIEGYNGDVPQCQVVIPQLQAKSHRAIIPQNKSTDRLRKSHQAYLKYRVLGREETESVSHNVDLLGNAS